MNSYKPTIREINARRRSFRNFDTYAAHAHTFWTIKKREHPGPLSKEEAREWISFFNRALSKDKKDLERGRQILNPQFASHLRRLEKQAAQYGQLLHMHKQTIRKERSNLVGRMRRGS